MDNSPIHNGMASQSSSPEHPPVAPHTTYGHHTTCPFVAQQQAQQAHQAHQSQQAQLAQQVQQAQRAQQAQQAQQAQPAFTTSQSATVTARYNSFLNWRPPVHSYYHLGQQLPPNQPGPILPTPYSQYLPPLSHATYLGGAPGLFHTTADVFPGFQHSPNVSPLYVPPMQSSLGNTPEPVPATVPRAIAQPAPAEVSLPLYNDTFPHPRSRSTSRSTSADGSGQGHRNTATLENSTEVAQSYLMATHTPQPQPHLHSPISPVPVSHVSMSQVSPDRKSVV